MIQMMKQVQQVRKMQRELAAKTVEASSKDGLVTVVACADMSVKSVRIDPQLLAPPQADRLARALVQTVNSALDDCKKAAAEDMAKLTGGLGGLADLLGKQA